MKIPLLLPTGFGAIKDAEECFRAAVKINKSGAHNWDCARILIASDMNLTKWAHYDELYNDKCLQQFLVYGFSLGRSSEAPNQEMVENHKSAMDYPEAIN